MSGGRTKFGVKAAGCQYESVDDKLFVLIGSADDATTTRLQARGVRYLQKNLNSGVTNWLKVIEGVRESRGTIVRLNRRNFEQLAGPALSARRIVGPRAITYEKHHELTPTLVAAIASVPHLVLVHEHILAGSSWEAEAPAPSWTYAGLQHEETLSDAARSAVLAAFDEVGVTVVPYRKNAEAAELASAFIDDNESELLLRIYLPSTLPYSDQASRLIGVFREWLTNVRRLGVRLASHKTAQGEVIEFFAGEGTSAADFDRELVTFQDYVGAIPDAGVATALLQGFGIDARTADEFVARHRLLLRRIQLDLDHERERRELTHRHTAETELVELLPPEVTPGTLRSLVHGVLPTASARDLKAGPEPPVVVNHQTFHAVYGNVQQTFGHAGPPADVARAFLEAPDGESQLARLAELSDADLPRSRRQQAAAGLKAFLFRAKDRVEQEAFRVAFAWVNSQIDL